MSSVPAPTDQENHCLRCRLFGTFLAACPMALLASTPPEANAQTSVPSPERWLIEKAKTASLSDDRIDGASAPKVPGLRANKGDRAESWTLKVSDSEDYQYLETELIALFGPPREASDTRKTWDILQPAKMATRISS